MEGFFIDRSVLKKRIETAAGRSRADLVLKNAQILNVFINDWVQTDLAITDGVIVGLGDYRGRQELDLGGKYLVPGFIDAHLHTESTLVTPAQLVGEVLPWGTTTLVADPHEFANVSGLAGIRYLLEQVDTLPCNLYVMMPSCVPATSFEDSGAHLTAADLQQLQDYPHVLGLGEMMNYPGVVAADDAVLDKLLAFGDRIMDGHAPMLSGKGLQAYRTAGIVTDHECGSCDEVAEKVAAGFCILAREGSAAKNLETLMRAAMERNLPFSRFAFCTDDKHIEDIRRSGHIRENVAKAIALGVPVIEAYKMSSFYGAQIMGLHGLGALAAGYQADIVVLDDPEAVTVHSVYYRGKIVSEGAVPLRLVSPAPAQELLHTVHVAEPTAAALRISCDGTPQPIIQLVPNQLTTLRADVVLPCLNGAFEPSRRYAKAAVLERHHATGKIGLGVVEGLNIHGALATTVGHDSHNLLVLGDSDDDMLLAVHELVAQGGGYIQVQDGSVLGRMALPICGLVTDADIDEVQQTLRQMKQTARQMGVPDCYDPFTTMSFLSLPVIPKLRLTDRGLFDVVNMSFI